MSINTGVVSETPKLKKIQYLAYGCGDFASNLCWTFIGSYLTIFYTNVVGMAPAIAATIMLIARIWDGVNDPMFGAIAERTNTKRGRFRPYIFYGAPILAILSVLTFTKFGSGSGSIVIAAIIYIACGMMYTVVNLSYGALSTVMTRDQNEIAQLNSWRMMGTNLSSVLLNAITPPLLAAFSHSAENYTAGAYTKVAIIFAICAVPLFYFVYAQCKENIKPATSATKVKLSDTLKTVFTNKPLMIVFAIQLIAMTAFFGRMGVVIYYLMYDLHAFTMIAAFMSLPSLMTVIGILLTKNFIVKVGKKKMAAVGYIGAGISLILIFFIGRVSGFSNIPLLLVMHCIYGFFCFSFPIPMAMVPDAINYQEDRTGIRSDGTSYATVSLSTKIGNAVGVAVALFVMGAMGYVGTAQEQTAQAVAGINIVVNLFFGILYLCCLIPLFLYPLNEKKMDEVLESLEEKRKIAESSEGEAA